MQPFILRSVQMADLDKLYNLIRAMKNPIASLPNDQTLLKKRIQLSERSFKEDFNKNIPAYYLFALENIQTKEIVGVSGIYSNTGGHQFLYLYQIKEEKFKHDPLHISKVIKALHVHKVKHGPSEMCSLYLNPKYRNLHLSPLLALGRYLFIKAFPSRFTKQIIANLRGFRDDNEKSPFWQALGKIFFESPLATVDTMKSLGHQDFIKHLMPRHPIYIPLLPKKAQAVIGKVHKKTEPALHLLSKQGFKRSNWVDLFDAGPYFIANKNKIKAIKNAKLATISKILPIPQDPPQSSPYLISNSSIDFRACQANLTWHKNNTISVTQDVANTLLLHEGDTITYVKFS